MEWVNIRRDLNRLFIVLTAFLVLRGLKFNRRSDSIRLFRLN